MAKGTIRHKRTRKAAVSKYRPIFTPDDLIRLDYDGEKAPATPPHPTFRWGTGTTPEQREWVMKAVIPPFHPEIAFDLLDSAWRLVQLSWQKCGGYREGLEPPANCTAAATGAITIATAAFEAALNEGIYTSSYIHAKSEPEKRLYELSMGLPIKARMEAFAALHRYTIEWGKTPFQELALVLTVRRCLLHHETRPMPLEGGFWPSPALREIPRRIKSPYKEQDLEWQQHVLTPAGAEWTVRCVFDVVGWIDRWVDPNHPRWPKSTASRKKGGKPSKKRAKKR